MTDAALSEYEAMRRRRIEENRRMLASLSLPMLPRASSRAHVSKPVAKMEPTRRSSRQRTRREIAKQDEQEKLQHEQETFKQHEVIATAQKVYNEQQKQQAAIIASVKHQQKQQRKQQQERKAQEISRKKQKTDERKFERVQKSKQQKLELQAVERKQQQLIQMRTKQLEWQKQHELPPEKIAQRNADIQKFIQEELDKQARLAREQKQWELDHSRWREEETLKQEEVHKQSATSGLVDENQSVGMMGDIASTVQTEAVMEEFEYELVL